MEERVSMEKLAHIIDSEGMDYAIQHYLSSDRVPKELESWWIQAESALNAIDAALAPYRDE